MRWFWMALLPLAIACSGDSDSGTAGDDDDTTVGDDDDTTVGDDDDGSGLDGSALYSSNCAVCHGATGEGSGAGPDMPTSVGGSTRDEVIDQILNGGGFMGPVNVSEEEAGAIADFALDTWG